MERAKKKQKKKQNRPPIWSIGWMGCSTLTRNEKVEWNCNQAICHSRLTIRFPENIESINHRGVNVIVRVDNWIEISVDFWESAQTKSLHFICIEAQRDSPSILNIAKDAHASCFDIENCLEHRRCEWQIRKRKRKFDFDVLCKLRYCKQTSMSYNGQTVAADRMA